jgi:hypothetical protein
MGGGVRTRPRDVTKEGKKEGVTQLPIKRGIGLARLDVARVQPDSADLDARIEGESTLMLESR